MLELQICIKYKVEPKKSVYVQSHVSGCPYQTQMMRDQSFVTSLSLLQHCLQYNNCQRHIKIYRDTRKIDMD